MTNPEAAVIDAIDALIDEQLARGPRDDYDRDYLARLDGGSVVAEVCSVCLEEWHGEPNDEGCPSEFGTDEAVEAYISNGPVKAPRWTLEELEAAGEQMARGYTIEQVAAMRGGFYRHDSPPGGAAHECTLDRNGRCVWASCPSNQGVFVDQIQAITFSHNPLLPAVVEPPPLQFPRDYPINRPRIRFWAADPLNGLMRMLEGTLDLRSWTAHQEGDIVTYEVQANLFPPVVQYVQDADVQIEARTWLPGDPELQPAEAVAEDTISVEIADNVTISGTADHPVTRAPEGFQPVGTIASDSLSVECNVDYQRSWGGRTLRTSEEWTVSFPITVEEYGPGWQALLNPT